MKNRTFAPGQDTHLNAVIGSDWPTDKTYSYVLGFEQAVEVLLAAATEEYYIDPAQQEPRAVYIDALIYPICFCARHFIELFLKRQITLVSALRGKPDDAAGTHDLADLWIRLKTHLNTDRRLAPLASPMEEFINDFAAIDETGETFRYAFDLKDNAHLGGLTHINVGILANRLKKLKDYAETFEIQMEILRNEYAQRTLTSKLSRDDLSQISKQLPKYRDWDTDALKEAKEVIRKEYNLSSNDFSRAICIIKSHCEFSMNIGEELPLKGVTEETFNKLKRIHETKETFDSVSKDEWARLAAVCEIGRNYEYSESFENLSGLFMSEEYESRVYPKDLLREILGRHNRFRIGLKKLGQPSLLYKFEERFPKEADRKPTSPDDLRETFKRQLQRMSSDPNNQNRP